MEDEKKLLRAAEGMQTRRRPVDRKKKKKKISRTVTTKNPRDVALVSLPLAPHASVLPRIKNTNPDLELSKVEHMIAELTSNKVTIRGDNKRD